MEKQNTSGRIGKKDLGQRDYLERPFRVHAPNLLAPADVKLLEAINRGEFLLNGFRNRDLREVLFADAPPATPEETKRQSAKVARLIGLLWRPRCDREGIENTSLPGDGGPSQEGDRIAGSSASRHRAATQSRTRKGVPEFAQ